MDRADGKNFVEAERGEFRGLGFDARGIDFVDGDQHRFGAAAQTLGGLAIERHDTFPHIDHQDDDVGGFDGELHLFEGRFDDDIIRLFAAQQSDAAGVHQRERSAAPFGFGADAVAGDARLIVNDSDAASDNAIKESGLADVWAANDGN